MYRFLGPKGPWVVAEFADMAIGLIPCAKGGSLIHDWRRNLDDNTLYGSCLKRARAASLMGNVAGLLYFQGEIDAVDPKEQPGRTFCPISGQIDLQFLLTIGEVI